MTRVLAFGGVRFVLAGVLAFALAACFVGRAEAALGASVVAGDRALTLKWGAVKGAAGYRVSWRGPVLKGGKPTAVWSSKWLGLKVLKASVRSYKVTGLVNGRQYELRLDSNTKAKRSRWVAKSTLVGTPSVPSCANGGVCVVGSYGPGGGKVFYAPGGKFTETGADCGSSCRYLEAAPVVWGDPSFPWGAGSGQSGSCSNKFFSFPALNTAIGSGMANTFAIMGACPSANPLNPQSAPAALAAYLYHPRPRFNDAEVVNGWFLPSFDELRQLDIASVAGLDSSTFYWSSTWDSLADYAKTQYVGVGAGPGTEFDLLRTEIKRVRPVRAF